MLRARVHALTAAAAASLLLALPAAAQMSGGLALSVSDSAPRRVSVSVGERTFFHSPPDGLWSVATDWAEGWPSGWVHASPASVEREGDWTIVSGEIALPGGALRVRDAYRLEAGLVRGVRRWTWTRKEILPRATLSVRWVVPGAINAKPMMPGVASRHARAVLGRHAGREL